MIIPGLNFDASVNIGVVRPGSHTEMSKRIHSFRSYFWIGTGQMS